MEPGVLNMLGKPSPLSYVPNPWPQNTVYVRLELLKVLDSLELTILHLQL